MEEISYINDYYQKIIQALDNNIHPKKIINLKMKIDAYTEFYKYCTKDDNNNSIMYQKYNDYLIEYCNKFNFVNIKNLNSFIKSFNILETYLYICFNYLDKHYIKHNELLNLEFELPNKILKDEIIDKNMLLIETEIKKLLNVIRTTDYKNYEKLIDENGLCEFLRKFKKNPVLDQNIFLSTKYYKTVSKKNFLKDNENINLINNFSKIWINEKTMFEYLNLENSYIAEIENNFKKIMIKDNIDYLIDNSHSGLINLLENNRINDLIFLINSLKLDNTIENKISDKLNNYFYDINNDILKDVNIDSILKVTKSYLYFKELFNQIDNKKLNNDLLNKISQLVNQDIQYIEIINEYFNFNLVTKQEIPNFDLLLSFISLISDKELFYTIYNTKLEYRLFNDQSNNKIENNYFLKLLDKLPYRKSSRIKTLFQDIKDTKSFNYEIQNLCNNDRNSYDLKILTTTYWNVNKNGYFKDINLDDNDYKNNLLITSELFNLKYNGLRKLYVNQTQGEIIINFNQKYKIKTLPIIASVLFCFNNVDTLSLEEIINQTKIEKELIVKIVNILINFNLFSKDENLVSINNNFTSDDQQLEINFNIQNKKRKISVIDSFKIVRIEAILVKIMKQSKEIEIEKLIDTVKNILIKFNPDDDTISKVINDLIEREYLEKDCNLIKYTFV